MRVVNLANLVSSAKGGADDDRVDRFNRARLVLSGAKSSDRIPLKEIDCLCEFVCMCRLHDIDVAALDDFYAFYKVPHVSKEIDLFKIGTDVTINVELKSEFTSEERIEKQLLENRYYLSATPSDTVKSYTHVSGVGLFLIQDGKIQAADWTQLKSDLESLGKTVNTPLEEIFTPSRFLVSPINDVQRFMNGSYYLTDHQRYIKKVIANSFLEGESLGFVIQGGAGTGKSLLVYDLAKSMAEKTGKKACVIHCGAMSDVHTKFNQSQSSIALIHAKQVEGANIKKYCFIGVDEAHRIHKRSFVAFIDKVNEADVPYIVSADERQILSHSEEERKIIEELQVLIPSERFFTLQKRIRSNADICCFIEAFFDLSKKKCVAPCHIIPVYAGNAAEAQCFLSYFRSKGFQQIDISASIYKRSILDEYVNKDSISAHAAIGQEFENVVVPVPDLFFREGTMLVSKPHPYYDYITTRLLYECMTRARTTLALVFDRCEQLYSDALSLLA